MSRRTFLCSIIHSLRSRILLICATCALSFSGISGAETDSTPNSRVLREIPELTPPILGPLDGSHYSPVLASNGHGEVLGVWAAIFAASNLVLGGNGVLGGRLDPNGRLLDSGNIVLEEGSFPAAVSFDSVAFNGQTYLAVWLETSDVYQSRAFGDLVMRSVSVDGVPGAKKLIASHVQFQRPPTLTSNGARFLAIWETVIVVSNETRLVTYSRIINADGTLGDFVQLTPNSDVDYQFPKVASGPNGFLVVWQSAPHGQLSNYDISGRFLHDDGTPAGDVFKIFSGGENWSPKVASNQDAYFVIYEHSTGTFQTSPFTILGLSVSTNGTVSDPIEIVGESQSFRRPVIASDGRDYLIAWDEPGAVGAKRVSAAGQILDPNGIPISSIDSRLEPFAPAAVFDGAAFVVAWQGVYWEGIIETARIKDGQVLARSNTVLNVARICRFTRRQQARTSLPL